MRSLFKVMICFTIIGLTVFTGISGCRYTKHKTDADNKTEQSKLEDFSVVEGEDQKTDSVNSSEDLTEDTEQAGQEVMHNDYYSISLHECPMTIDEYTYTAEEGDGYNIFTCTKNDAEVFSIDTISDNILSNGESYYYLNDDPSWIAIAKYDAEKQEWNNIFYEYDFDNFPHLVSYFNNKIYFIEGIVPGGNLCTYDQETEEKETVMEEINFAQQYGDVLVCGREYDSLWSPRTLNTFNMMTGEATQICEKTRGFDVISDRLYYVEYLHPTEEDSVGEELADTICNAYSCDLDGSNKKELFSEKRVPGGISEITESGIRVSQYNSETGEYTDTEISYGD